MRTGGVLAACIASMVLIAANAGAREDPPGGRSADRPTDGLAAPMAGGNPSVWIIGDSITADPAQRTFIHGNFGWMGWRTHIESTPGATMREHWQTLPTWNTFRRAAKSDARVIIVELGTNDAALFPPQDTNNLTKTLNYLKYTDNWLRINAPGKCIIQMGVDDTGGSQIFNGTTQKWMPYVDGYTGIWFNTTARAQATGNVHFADYAAKLVTDPAFKATIYQTTEQQKDYVHIKTDAGKETFALWLRAQVRGSCPNVPALH